MNTDKLNEYPNSKENETVSNLANKILDFYDCYDPYWSFGSSNDDLANTIMQLKNSDTRQNLIDNLQKIIATEKKSPCMSSNSFISLAEQLKNEITNYGMEILDTSKKKIMEENTMENQQTQSTAKFFNKHSYGEIENKTFISCDSKTAYEIGQKAQEQGITYSAKFDGDKSAVVVDGVKDKEFVDAVKAEFKVHTPDEPTFFNSRAYKDIENKTFISCDAKTAYEIGQKAQEQGITHSAKFDGNKSSVVVDGVKDKAFVDAVKAEFKVHTPDEPTFFNKKAYKDIENKEFINTDAKTAYAIGQKAQEQGITFSAKFDGDNSAVTVDGVKNKAFVDAVKAEFNIVDKINYVEDISDKIQDAIDNGELDIGKNEQSIGQER